MVIFNNAAHTVYKCYDSFESGGVSREHSTGEKAIDLVEPYTARASKVESHGFMTGVTGADVRFRFTPGKSSSFDLRIVTSNPYAGDNSGRSDCSAHLKSSDTLSVGDNNRFDVVVYGA